MNKCTFDTFECQQTDLTSFPRHLQPLRNYVLSGPITALTVRVNATRSSNFLEVHIRLRPRVHVDLTQKHKLGFRSKMDVNQLKHRVFIQYITISALLE